MAQRSRTLESLNRTRDGRVFPVEISTIIFEYGGRAFNLALVRNITERKRAEDELRRTWGYLAETQRLTHTGTAVADSTTAPLYWSDELYRIFGFDPEQGLPTADQPLQRIHPKDLDQFRQAFQRLIKEKVDAEVEYRIVWAHLAVRGL
jgi:PAS domain-containing protein